MFGQTSSFGTNNNTNNSSPFGGGQTSSGFGGFGSSSTTTNNNTSPFGGGGGFGSNANNNNTNAFGSTTNNAYGSTSSTPFGSPPANSGGGLFGSSSTNTNTFGTSSGGFSAPAPTTSLFGAPAAAPSSSIFGAPSTSTNTGGLFGSNNNSSNTGGGLFGNSTSNTTSSFGGFGSPAPAPQPSGFGFGSSNTTTTSNTFGASNTFGTSNQSTGLFGAPAAASSSPFGGGATNTGTVTSKSAAYQPTDQQDGLSNTRIQLQSITAMSQYSNVSFEELRLNDYLSGNKGSGGSSGTFGGSSMFGGNNTQSGGLFGTAAPAPSTGFSFGSAPKPASGFGSGGFGGAAPAPSLFGAPSPAPSGSLFGAPAPSSNAGGLFGAPATSAPSGGFGFGSTISPAPAQNQTGLFGSAPSTGGGLFGNTPTPSTGLFGAPAPAAPSSGGLFGGKSPVPGGSLFGGTPAPSSGFSFGNPTSPAPAPTGLFGAAPSTGGIFGNSAAAPAPTGLFGATTPAPSAGIGLFGAKSPAPAGGLFGAPAPSTGLFSSPPVAVAPIVTQQPSANQSLQQKMALIEHQRQENAKMEPWRGNSLSASTKVSDVGKTVHTNSAVQYKIPRPLTSTPASLARIRPRGFTPHMSANVIKSSPTKAFGGFNSSSPSQNITSPINGSVKSLAIRSEVLTGTTPRVKHRVQLLTNGNDNPKVLQFENSEPSIPLEATVNEDLIPILTKPNYTTNPPISVLENMTETELATVENFSIEHSTHGSIRWIGDIDVRGVNLDDAVTICAKEAIVYAREEENDTKPKLGTKLNRAAVITLKNIYPKEGMDGKKYSSKIKRMTVKMGAKFVEYDFEEGVWMFEVDHFSRYGFIDDEDSSDDEDVDKKIDENVKPQQQLVPWDAAAKAHQSPFFMKKSQGHAVVSDEFSEVDRRIDEEMDVDGVQRMAELAFAALDEGNEVKALSVVSKSEDPEPVRLEPDDDELDTMPTASSQRFDVSALLPNVQRNFSILRHAVGRCSSKSRSRVHPRFRAGWSSRLSFVKLVPGSNNKITIVRPKLQCDDLSPNIPLLELHRRSSIASKIGTHSEFSLPSAKAEMFAIIRKYASLHPATQMVNVLYGQNPEMDLADDENISKIDRARRRGAMLRFFTSILPANNMLEAVVAHDRKLACKLAFDRGFFHLSTLLASPCHQMDKQVALWQGTGYLSDLGDLELQRIYSILGNDLDIERELFSTQNASALSWQQRICIDLVRGYDIDLKDVIINYEKEVKEGEAPSPIGNSSVLYHLLRFSSIEDENIQNSLKPSGYGATQHDYGLAWHLLQIFDLLALSSERSGIDRKLHLKVLYSMTSQLILHRQYHWAIYVSLCTLTCRVQTQNSLNISNHNMNSDLSRIQELELAENAHVEFAKHIITRYIHVMPKEQIKFLTSATADGGLKIPIEWIESARAQYAGYCGDDSSFVHALASAGMYDECARATRALILPKAVSQGGENIKKLRIFLSDLAKATGDDIQRPFWSEPNGCGVFLELFELEDRVSDLMLTASDNQFLDAITDRVEEELVLLKKLEGRVLDFRGKGISNRAIYYLACRCEQERKFEAACVLHALSIIGALKSQLRLLCEVTDNLVDKSLAQITSIECALFGESDFSSNRTDGIDRVRGAAGYFSRSS